MNQFDILLTLNFQRNYRALEIVLFGSLLWVTSFFYFSFSFPSVCWNEAREIGKNPIVRNGIISLLRFRIMWWAGTIFSPLCVSVENPVLCSGDENLSSFLILSHLPPSEDFEYFECSLGKIRLAYPKLPFLLGWMLTCSLHNTNNYHNSN